MDTVGMRSPDLSIRFSISLCMDAEDDDDLSFFCDDEKAKSVTAWFDTRCGGDAPLPRCWWYDNSTRNIYAQSFRRR